MVSDLSNAILGKLYGLDLTEISTVCKVFPQELIFLDLQACLLKQTATAMESFMVLLHVSIAKRGLCSPKK